ncbi:type 3 dihydrofolate reductase [Aestuariibacter sp. AA17]|uniref:Dihydrofolate reductase n=2 Tax=Fluctibacter corallii TaxID=2984329 RepID=A0ABT3A7R3_9ALTE|nr:type 3 dihydrofolate reductase [Aestuariibacter sp. AA17]MCV2884612.1 type 3 dihydrofolate reductase [Aestuariibacter sp. AA17]
MIAAMANGRVIGKDNTMPWHLPADLAHFKRVTLGKPVIMGRKTFESIGRPLPGRLNIVISRNPDFKPDNVTCVSSCEQALVYAQEHSENVDEIMIIGGGTVYDYFLPHCDTLYLTEIELDAEGDTCFPDYQKDFEWSLIDEEKHNEDDRNPYAYRFLTLKKVGVKQSS